MHLLDKLMQRR
uniref:Uncharacterized protein n=1 Tax=Arundo donax TaxID=35708 RepID=A0A0A9B6H8_ARUDO